MANKKESDMKEITSQATNMLGKNDIVVDQKAIDITVKDRHNQSNLFRIFRRANELVATVNWKINMCKLKGLAQEQTENQ